MPASHVFTPAISQLTTSGAAPPSKAYTSAVQAGDLLWCFAWVNSASATVTGLSDSVNGAWTQAFGPIRGNAANLNASLYGFYKVNSAAGTPTLTLTTSANTQGAYVFGAIRGLAGGGDLDQFQGLLQTADLANGWQLPTTTLAQAEEAGIGVLLASSGGSGTPRWTADLSLDSANFERTQRIITSSTSPTTFGTSSAVTGGSGATLGLMMFKGLVVATLSGNVTMDDAAPGGGMSSVASSLSGNVTLDDAAPAGTLGAAPGRIRLLGASDEWRNKAGTLLASKACTVDVHSTAGTHVARISTATASDGLIPEISHGSISQSTLYRVDVLFGTGEYGVVYRTSEAT